MTMLLVILIIRNVKYYSSEIQNKLVHSEKYIL